ncbi:hypothetical protein [Zhihengliuella salsuginis]|uniref:Uncharacterized protein n=1 Tax=Zhihengliuella salsuginis TaxID=578222 RepID=A0ABQ3GHU8_9MICC|nr:hypothetical protein [Zhihengliuella salsuginis]GHD07598.1 hypothetical protein GCM10008096_18510 [Zhihengliuella salsuginis]
MKSIIGAIIGATLASIAGAEAYVTVMPRLQAAYQRYEIDPISASLYLGGIPALFLVVAFILHYWGGRPSRAAGVAGLGFTFLCVASYYAAGLQFGAERFGYHSTVVFGLVLMYGWSIIVGDGRRRGRAGTAERTLEDATA